MGVLDFIAGIFKPATDIIDKVHTSEAERLELQNALAKINAEVTTKLAEAEVRVMELQAKLVEQSSKVSIAEAGSESWFVRHYKPIIVSCMFVLILGESFGLLKTELPEIFWQIFGASFGVLTATPAVGKGLSKVAEVVKGALTKK